MSREETKSYEEGVENLVKAIGEGLIKDLLQKYNIIDKSCKVDCYGTFISEKQFKIVVRLPDHGVGDYIIVNLENSSYNGGN